MPHIMSIVCHMSI